MINKADEWEQTPLHFATAVGRLKICNLLLENGAKPDLKTPQNNTPLHIAASEGNLDIVRLLVENMSRNIDSQTSIKSGHKKRLRNLFLNCRNEDGNAPLHMAIISNHIEVIKYLIKNEAKINVMNKYVDTPLHMAARIGSRAMIKILIQEGARKNLKNIHGLIPLHLSIPHGDPKTINLILSPNNKIFYKSGRYGITRMANAKSNQGSTPLHIAVDNGHIELVKILIKNGAQVNIQNEHGIRPLHIAKYQNFRSITKLLIHNGAEKDDITIMKLSEEPSVQKPSYALVIKPFSKSRK